MTKALPLIVLAAFATSSLAQIPPAVPGEYEVVPILKASEILQLPYLVSPNHKVREEVETLSRVESLLGGR